MKNVQIALILAVFTLCVASPALADNNAYYTNHPSTAYGPSHYNYHANGGNYGPAKDNYNGHQSYGSAPKTGSPVDTYSTSKKAISSSIAY